MEIKIVLDDLMSSVMIRMLEQEIENQEQWIRDDERDARPQYMILDRKEIINKCLKLEKEILNQRKEQREKGE